jgi:hypothetical protein
MKRIEHFGHRSVGACVSCGRPPSVDLSGVPSAGETGTRFENDVLPRQKQEHRRVVHAEIAATVAGSLEIEQLKNAVRDTYNRAGRLSIEAQGRTAGRKMSASAAVSGSSALRFRAVINRLLRASDPWHRFTERQLANGTSNGTSQAFYAPGSESGRKQKP